MRIEALTFLRFFAAFVVVVFHYGRGSVLAKWAHPLMISGSQMVTFFFVLSGFVLMISHHGRGSVSLGRFYLARVARIAPIYWVALALAFFALRGTQHIPTADLALHASFLHAWFPGHVYLLNFPAWSVSVEAFFYVSFPLALLFIKARPISASRLLWSSIALWLVTQIGLIFLLNSSSIDPAQREWFDTINFLPINHLCSFFLGLAGGYAFIKHKPQTQATGAGSILACAMALGIVFISLKYGPRLQAPLNCKLPFKVSLLAPVFLLLVWTLARSNNLVTRALSMGPLVLLGEASYSLYILQTPVNILVRKHVLRERNFSLDEGFLIYLAILVPTSIATMYLIERPGRRLILNWGSRFPKLVPPAPSSK